MRGFLASDTLAELTLAGGCHGPFARLPGTVPRLGEPIFHTFSGQDRAQHSHGGPLVEQLSGMDASFLYFETPHAPMHIGSFTIYDPSTAPGGFVRFKDILAHVESRLHLSRAFRQKLVHVPMNLDHPYWINDSEFDLEFHVRHIALPRPGDWRQLCIQAARLHSRPLDLGKPLWEIYVIEGLDNVEDVPPGSFAVLMKIHHAIIDGVSGSEITTHVHDVEPVPRNKPVAQPWQGESPPSTFELIARANLNNLTQPMRFFQVTARALPGFARMSAGISSRQLRVQQVAPRTRFNRSVTAHRVVDGRSFPLDEIRAIKAAVPGATVNDAVLAIVGGALNGYLKHHGELPERSLVAMAPISVRDASQRDTAGNQVAAMMTELGTQIDDPLERLAAVHESTVNSKAMTNAIGARNLADYSQFVPSQLAGLAARLSTSPEMRNVVESTAPAFNTVVTNVPGPQTPLYFAGAQALKFVGLGPVYDGMALIHPVFSYCGKLAISFTSCREILHDPEVYADYLQGAFEELRSAAAPAAGSSGAGA